MGLSPLRTERSWFTTLSRPSSVPNLWVNLRSKGRNENPLEQSTRRSASTKGLCCAHFEKEASNGSA